MITIVRSTRSKRITWRVFLLSIWIYPSLISKNFQYLTYSKRITQIIRRANRLVKNVLQNNLTSKIFRMCCNKFRIYSNKTMNLLLKYPIPICIVTLLWPRNSEEKESLNSFSKAHSFTESSDLNLPNSTFRTFTNTLWKKESKEHFLKNETKIGGKLCSTTLESSEPKK